MRKNGLLFIIVIILSIFSSCGHQSIEVMNPDVVETTKETPEPVIHQVTLKAVGDIMFHEYQLTRSYDQENDSFDFSDTFTYIEKYLTDADYTVGNLETTFGGPNGAHDFSVEKRVAGYSGYPCFNTPDIAATTLKDIGFDLLTTANNHSLDSKETGLFRTLEVLDENGLLHIGTYRTAEEANKIEIVDIEGIKFAFISFTYAMNGFMPSEGNSHIINSLDMYTPEKEQQMCELVKKAAEQNPDFVVVMPHFGNEYIEYPNSYQENLVNQLFEAGADIIFGSHPHVLQPIEVREINRSNGEVDQGIVIYSLGNFISSQKYEPGMNKDLGVIMGLNIVKVENNKAIIEEISLTPTYTYWQDDVIGVLPVDEALEKIKEQSIILPQYDINRLEFAKEYSIKHLMTNLEEYTYLLQDHTYFISLK